MATSSNLAKVEQLGDYVPGGFKLTGWRVFGIVMLFFGTIAAVDFTMIRFATSTISGEVTEHPYESGLAYDKEIANSQVQNALKWQIDAHGLRDASGVYALAVDAHDAAGAPLDGLKFTARLQAPADTKRDVAVALSSTGHGHYTGSANVAAGQWDLVISAMQEDKRVFLSTSRIKLQ